MIRKVVPNYYVDRELITCGSDFVKMIVENSFGFLFTNIAASRPGVLVIINGSDWELEDGLNYKVQDGDELVFISTLHGG